MATIDSAITTQWLPPLSQYTSSASRAATPENASGHQFVAWPAAVFAGTDSARIAAPSPSDSKASISCGRTPGTCVTVNDRCVRLKSSAATPAMPPSLLRIRPSSVGQSIFAMVSTVVSWADGPSIRVARISTAASACSIGASDGNVCSTVNTRCSRLNPRVKTPSMPPSFCRIMASSVGQSMFSMR